MNSNNIIPKVKFNPLDRINKQKNNHNLEKEINYDSYLKQPSINCLKDSKLNQPKYFYQRKRVCEPIETNNLKSESKQNSFKNLHGSKHYPIPLIKNQPVMNEEPSKKVEIDSLTRGECSRLDTFNFQREREAREELRFQFLDKNFQDPSKLVLPFPRGGEMTREKYYKNQNYQ